MTPAVPSATTTRPAIAIHSPPGETDRDAASCSCCASADGGRDGANIADAEPICCGTAGDEVVGVEVDEATVGVCVGVAVCLVVGFGDGLGAVTPLTMIAARLLPVFGSTQRPGRQVRITCPGAVMRDTIFNSTAPRKSVGAPVTTHH